MIKLAAGALLLALTTVAHAGTIVDLQLDGNFYSDYTFFSYTDIYGQQQNNIPIDPYITYLNGSGYDDTLAYTFCFDFNSPTNVGEWYSGTFETPSDPATLEATYLINQLSYYGMINSPLPIRGSIALAIWEVMNPSSTTSMAVFPTDPASIYWEDQAATAVANGSWTDADSARYPTWIPDNPSIQRFGMVFVNEVPLPEPANMVVIGLGLIGVGLWGRKRRANQAAPPAA